MLIIIFLIFIFTKLTINKWQELLESTMACEHQNKALLPFGLFSLY